jgi:hypothetical protein
MTKKSKLSRHGVFGPPLAGEDAAAYDQLFARLCAAVKPIDIIDEMFVNDIMCLQREVLRLRRLKSCLIRDISSKALQEFLFKELGYARDKIWEILSEIVGDQPEVQELARKYLQDEPDASINALLSAVGQETDKIPPMSGTAR